MPEQRFTGKVAFLTGAGSGIGRAAAIRLAAEGATVVGADINTERLDEVSSEVKACGGGFTSVELDIADRGACFAAIADTVASHGRLDVLGNIAGFAWGEHFTDIAEDRYRRLMAVNVDGAFFLSQAAIPHLLETSGNIVNISSNAGVTGVAYLVPYSMAKGAIVNLTKSLAMEYVRTGLRVNAIAPAGTTTNIGDQFSLPTDIDPELAARMAGYRGSNEAEEVAALFALVASEEAPGIHGAILRIDRGVTVG